MPPLPRLLLVLSLLALTAAGGCHSPHPSSSISSPPTPYILHLPGVSGPLAIDRALATGLSSTGLPQLEIYDWTQHDPGLHALTAFDRNQHQAQLVADKLTSEYHAHPNRPILLTSHSGGTAIAVWALEKCPPDVKIQTLLLMESALSPSYDLSPALQHVTGHAYAFFSPHDNIVLGTGTSVFGTMDRVYTQAAGMVGFKQPDHPKDPSQYAKLIPMPYLTEWMSLGNIGDHIGPMRQAFAAQVLAPLLQGTAPNLKEPGEKSPGPSTYEAPTDP